MASETATALYVHVPFCVRKCRYCDFYSVAEQDELIDPYLDALESELRKRAPALDIRTIYVGGGTPTVLRTEKLERLLEMLGERLELAHLIEFTVEANPGTVDAGKLAMMKANGVNRVSLGVQSFSDKTLTALGRIHDAAQGEEAIRQAREAGFENVSIDLIFATPGQSLDELEEDLEKAIDARPEHISAYGLTYEEGTPMGEDERAGRIERVKEETELLMFRTVRKRLAGAGFEHYEISNYGQPGKRSIHNQVYWRNDPYVGVGPGAASYVAGTRSTNVRDVKRYVELIAGQGDATGERETLTGRRRAGETAMLGLRRAEGINEKEFKSRTGFELRKLAGEEFERLVEMGLITCEDGWVALTERGMEVGDAVIEEFM